MKFKKTILSGLIAISAIALLPSNVFAAGNQALLIGRNYGSGNIDTTIDVTNAKNGLGALTFNYQDNTNPTISWMQGSNGSTKRMESDILFFSGHGNSSLMRFYDQNHTPGYDFYITTGYNSSTDVGLSSYNMSNVKLAVFAGCQTAYGSSNITKTAQTKGAQKSIGWIPSIGASAHTEWLKNFWSRAGKEFFLSNAVVYADSFIYSDNGVKQHNQYGNWNQPLKTASKSEYNKRSTPFRLDDRNNVVDIDVNNFNDNQIINSISTWIVNNINSDFNIANYEIEKTTQEDKNIYDIKLTINGNIKTKLGYTAFVSNGKITNIFNNMDNKNNKNLELQITQALLQKNAKSLSTTNIVEKANEKIDFDIFEKISQETYSFFDDADGKIYQIVRTELKNKNDGTFYVDEYKIEI